MPTHHSISLRGTGRALPDHAVSLQALIAQSPPGAAPALQGSGVTMRYHCRETDQITLGLRAAQAALAAADLPPAAIDLLIFTAAVPYQPIPATAPLLLRALGLDDGQAAGFDVNSTCLGFLTAFEIATRQIAAGVARHVLIVAAEVASRGLPWAEDPGTAALFGDGAAAAVLAAPNGAPADRMVAARMRSYPSGALACALGAGGTRFDLHADPAGFAAHSRFAMDGRALFRLTAQHLRGFVDDLLAQAGWTRDSVDLVIPHQASPAALAHMARLTGFAPAKVVDISASHGNQIAASIPFALDLARRQGRIAPGARLLLLGTSAGVSFGGIALACAPCA